MYGISWTHLFPLGISVEARVESGLITIQLFVAETERQVFRHIRRKEYRLAVGTHYRPTPIHQACYSPRHGRDSRAGTMILFHLRIYNRAQPLPVTTTGQMGLLEHCRRRSTRRGRRTVYGTTGRPEQRTPLANPPGPHDLPGTTGRSGTADAAADSAEAAVPSEGLRAVRSSERTMPEYTATRG